MTDATYDQLKAQAILGCESAGDIMDSLHEVNDPQATQTILEIAKITLMGAQVYATLAVAEAEKDSMRSLEERSPKRPARPLMNTAHPRPVTPINKFQKDAE